MKEAEEKQLLDYRRRVIPTREGTFTGNSARGMQGEQESKGAQKRHLWARLLALLKEGDASVPSLSWRLHLLCPLSCAGFLLSHPDPCPFVRVHPSLLVCMSVCLYVLYVPRQHAAPRFRHEQLWWHLGQSRALIRSARHHSNSNSNSSQTQ